ncbi:hypothetical protein [Streptomyces sp. NPDC094032]|uniref:hypothetical protein n=1 Tax=Streptomyces sp. NPDC094032 TaxID=3155308 RepID=UPI003325C75A
MNRDQDDDLRMLRQLLPVPTDRDFPAGRQIQREEHLMTSLLTKDQGSERKRRGVVRFAVPTGLAAAVAGAALILLPAQSAAAYTVQSGQDGKVRLTIAKPDARIDLSRLQQDLAKAGVHAKVFTGDPNCASAWTPPPLPPVPPGASLPPAPSAPDLPTPTAPPTGASNLPAPPAPSFPVTKEGGKTVVTIDPTRIPHGKELLLGFPLAKGDSTGSFAEVLPKLPVGAVPACLPAGQPG